MTIAGFSNAQVLGVHKTMEPSEALSQGAAQTDHPLSS